MTEPTHTHAWQARQDEVRLGCVAGFPVGMNWSVLVIAWLLTWSLATGGLPHGAPGHAAGTYWAAGAVAAVVFLASLLAHELAHSVVARRSGIEVTGITLWLFGGVASLSREPETPAADLRIAAAGPGASLALAGLFGVGSLAVEATSAPHILASVTGWLAGVNLMLGLFNLIPGAPLDGGRVLRAIVWRLRGDRHQAALIATSAGAVVGYGLIGLGLTQFLVAGGIGGLWFVFIGWFLLNAARAEKAHERIRHALTGVKMSDAMTPATSVIPAWLAVGDAIERHALTDRIDVWPVEGFDGRIAGVVTIDGLRAVPVDERTATQVSAITIPADALVQVPLTSTVIELLGRADSVVDRPVLVSDGDRVVGIVTGDDLERVAGRRLGATRSHH
ncbi:site-2 protease family protein [Iamia sp. SCSIO 61187]|uniref:site-2 protease family protein n=1 Tax=Iamia sp. SCSIO 61187 TaxID=2722752 RepID=UPI001C62B14D|nr:site-2 protease family protein [Iamia sp. SCSIO 61187]QYG94280.1 site-2 protease family protein [Iamia sp. SCSIO 61187]